MSKIRINDLARELEVKSKAILDVLQEVGVTEKKTHSSSLEDHEAEKVRAQLRRTSEGHGSARQSARSGRGEPEGIKTKIDLSHISKPGDVLKAIIGKQQGAAPAQPPAPVAKPTPPAAKPDAPPTIAKPPAAAPAPPSTSPAPPAGPRVVTPSVAPRPVAPPASTTPAAPPSSVPTSPSHVAHPGHVPPPSSPIQPSATQSAAPQAPAQRPAIAPR